MSQRVTERHSQSQSIAEHQVMSYAVTEHHSESQSVIGSHSVSGDAGYAKCGEPVQNGDLTVEVPRRQALTRQLETWNPASSWL